MLRLEHLFDRLGQLIPRDAAVDHHYALATMFEIMDVASRADLAHAVHAGTKSPFLRRTVRVQQRHRRQALAQGDDTVDIGRGRRQLIHPFEHDRGDVRLGRAPPEIAG